MSLVAFASILLRLTCLPSSRFAHVNTLLDHSATRVVDVARVLKIVVGRADEVAHVEVVVDEAFESPGCTLVRATSIDRTTSKEPTWWRTAPVAVEWRTGGPLCNIYNVIAPSCSTLCETELIPAFSLVACNTLSSKGDGWTMTI